MIHSTSLEIDACSMHVPGRVEPVRVDLGFGYMSDEPYSIYLLISVRGEPEAVEWEFSRDIIRCALNHGEGGGEGDVKVIRSGPRLGIALKSPMGSSAAITGIDADKVRRFLRRTERLVPPGRESEMFDLDAEALMLMEEEQ